MQAYIRRHVADIDAAPAGLGLNLAANIVELDATAAAFCVHAPGNPGCRYASALGFNFDFLHLTGNVDGEISRELVHPSALPVAHDPGGVSVDVSADLVIIEIAAGFFFRATVGMITDGVADALLRTAVHLHRADIHLHSEIFHCRQRSRDLLRPIPTVTKY